MALNAIQSHYNKLSENERTQQEREELPLKNLFKFNNWVKTILISHHLHHDKTAVLDLCCGKGADLRKYNNYNNNVSYYMGIDNAQKSLENAVQRCTSINPSFPVQWVHASASQKHLMDKLSREFTFHLVSCQFALHYMFDSKDTSDAFFENVSARLLDGGKFIATFPDARVISALIAKDDSKIIGKSPEWKMDFSDTKFNENDFNQGYYFTLQNAIDHCKEYMVPIDLLIETAQNHNLQLIIHENFHEFFENHKQEQYNLIVKMKAADYIKDKNNNNIQLKLSPIEWEIASLYCVAVFQKTHTKS